MNHRLYRFFDKADRLLYVGRTIDPSSRFRAHRRDKGWWDQVSRVELETLPSAESLERAELEAIKAEDPVFNIVGRWKSKKHFRVAAIVAQGWHLAHDLIDGHIRYWGDDCWAHFRFYSETSAFHPRGFPSRVATHDAAYVIEFGTFDLCQEAARAVATADGGT